MEFHLGYSRGGSRHVCVSKGPGAQTDPNPCMLLRPLMNSPVAKASSSYSSFHPACLPPALQVYLAGWAGTSVAVKVLLNTTLDVYSDEAVLQVWRNGTTGTVLVRDKSTSGGEAVLQALPLVREYSFSACCAGAVEDLSVGLGSYSRLPWHTSL